MALADAGEGRTLAAGTASADGRGVFLLRLLPGGAPDPDFGDDGLLRLGGAQDAAVSGLQLWALGNQVLLVQDDGQALSATTLTPSGMRLPGMTRRLVLGPRGGAAVTTLFGGRIWTAHAAGGDPSPIVVQRFDLAGGAAGGQ